MTVSDTLTPATTADVARLAEMIEQTLYLTASVLSSGGFFAGSIAINDQRERVRRLMDDLQARARKQNPATLDACKHPRNRWWADTLTGAVNCGACGVELAQARTEVPQSPPVTHEQYDIIRNAVISPRHDIDQLVREVLEAVGRSAPTNIRSPYISPSADQERIAARLAKYEEIGARALDIGEHAADCPNACELIVRRLATVAREKQS